MYILYGGRFTRSLMVEMVLAEGGLAYEHREIDIDKDEHRAPDFLAVNPAGLVPALITPEGETLTETPAINLTLAERHGLRQLAPGPEEPERGRFLSALFFLTDELEPALKRHFYPQRYVLREEDAPAMAQRAMDDALARFALIEGQLGDDPERPYHLGARYSLADLTLAYWAISLELDAAAFPAIDRCSQLVAARPALGPLFARLAEEMAEYTEE